MAISRFVLPYADVGAGIRPSSGAKLFFYATGTSTFKSTFTDATGSTANTNPVIANANGVFPNIFLEGIFNVALKDSNDVQIWTADPATYGSLASQLSVDNRVIRVSSRTDMKAYDVPAGYQFSLEEGGRSGLFVVKAGTPAADPQEGIYVVLTNGNYAERLYSGALNVKWFGAIGDGAVDDTLSVQTAANFSDALGKFLYCESGEYRLTSTINSIDGSLFINGAGINPIDGNIAQLSTKGKGTWFFLDHSGVGFEAINANGDFGMLSLKHLGTYRNRADPTGTAAGSYVPEVFGADVRISVTDCIIEDVVLLNPTIGVDLVTGGRLNITNLRGQPISEGVIVQQATDLIRIRDVHFWPFWSINEGVLDYQLKNTIGFKIGRCDNPVFDGLFTIGYFVGMELYQAPLGSTAKAKISNIDLDEGQTSVLVSGNNVSAAITNMSSQGKFDDISLVYSLLQINGSGADIALTNADLRFCTANAIRNQGSGSILNASNVSIAAWNYSNAGYLGIESAVSDAEIYLDKKPNILVGSPHATAFAGGVGTVKIPLTNGSENITTNGSGSINITHNAGITPNVAFSNNAGGTSYFINRVSLTSTLIVFQVTDSSGSAVASTSISLSWSCSF
jgi:hypothetical protein